MIHATPSTDDLVLLSAFLAGAVVVPRLRLRWRVWQRTAWRLATFAVATALVVRDLGSPLRPRFDASAPAFQFWEQGIDAAWWLLAGRLAVGVVRLLVVLENRPRETRIVSDLLAGAVYVATILCIVAFGFAVPIRGLLATSGVIAIVLGLALQSTLGDVFSGIAVGLEHPYKPGDHLWIEGGIEGRVIQVGWRSTQVATDDGNVAIIPNNVVAKSRLVNRSAPTERRGDVVTLDLHADAAPESCVAALTAAACACRNLLHEPSPVVSCVGLRGEGATYRIDFSVASSGLVLLARTELFGQAHRHLRHAGIPLAVSATAALLPAAVPTAAELLDRSDLFGALDPAHREQLAASLVPVSKEAGAKLLRRGEPAKALFIVASGTVAITGEDPNRVVYRLGPGETLGAVGLITGEPYSIDATALTPVKAFRLDRAAIAALVDADPSLSNGLDALARRALAVLRRGITPQDDARLDQPDAFLAGFRNVLRLLRA